MLRPPLSLSSLEADARARLAARFWSKVEVMDPESCWTWVGYVHPNGYGTFAVGRKRVLSHRVAYALGNGDIGEGRVVCHRCDNSHCVNPSHLWLGSDADNNADMRAKHRDRGIDTLPQKGAQNTQAKLTDEAVLAIREACASGLSQTGVARQYGVTQSHVSDIITRRRWAHLA